ncbi:hypothetical protein DICPUDRAFT_158832 [Dictyostelium purpureum]|uniref:Uncharacterized protein n=1 Tax=Dictyostelium purpureum TaxID=5786 RepID=F1A2L5_DICPU|nr:uncharacterized protein DICPUDRAFT_158832 [Dictyostelium purpureum]EGC29560.1 hypothetical protein DICPUDRAFT_158832 [Dictyostelium purpureum]|eukprot:XP_003293909.1 hypothetical protein DICPUDRAFT_158832 [Dictyostelium purpureum]
MNQNKRTNNQTIRKTVEEFKWNTKDSSFKNVYKNYQDLCNLFNTPIEIFNDNLTSLNQIERKTDYNNFNLQFFGCNDEHISTIKVRSIFSSTYDATKTNIKCKECGTKTTVKLVQNLKDAVASNRFFLTLEQLNQYIEKFQKSTWLQIRKESYQLPCGTCKNTTSISSYTIESGKFHPCPACDITKTVGSLIQNMTEFITRTDSSITEEQFDQFKLSLSRVRVIDYPTVPIDIRFSCGHINKFNANQFVHRVEGLWSCNECSGPKCRESLLKGLSTLYDNGCISSSLYNSHLDCDECSKMGKVASRIIKGIDFQIESKSFTINNYEELVQEIGSLDAYSIQSYEFIVKLPCGHDHGIKNSFIYYNGKRNIDTLARVF